MDFLNLNAELESRQIYINRTMKTLDNFHIFFNTIYKNLNQFSISTHDSLKILFNDLMQYDNHSTLSKNFFEFYRYFEKFVSKTKQISEKIQFELVEPTQLIHKHLQDKNNQALNELKEIINSVVEQKKTYEISKHNYFDACKTAEKQETRVIQSLDDKDKSTGSEIEVEKQHNLLVQYRTIAEDNCQKYKADLKVTNVLFNENDEKYQPIAIHFQYNEESRKNFLKYHFEKLYSFIDDYQNSLQTMTSSLKQSIVVIDIEEDLRKYNNKFSYLNAKNERIPKEDFLQYDIYRRNFEALIQSNMTMFKTLPNSLPITKLSDMTSQHLHQIVPKKYYFEPREDMIISSLFNETANDKKSVELFKLKLKTRHHFAKDFIDKIMDKCMAIHQIKLEYIDKLILFGDCLSHVAMNDHVNNEMFSLHFTLIHIAETTFFQLPNGQRLYLSRILSDLYPYFKSKLHWKKLLMLKIASDLETITKEEIDKRMKDEKKKKSNSGYSLSAFFNSSQAKENYNTVLNEIQSKEVFGILKEFMLHLASFSIDSNDISDILMEIASMYDINKNQLSVLIAMTNSNLHSIRAKRYSSRMNGKKHMMGKIPLLYNQSHLEQNFLLKTKFKNESTHLYGVILNSLKYIPHREYINVLCLNKAFQQKTSKYIYKSLLWDNSELLFDTRVSLWKNSIKYHTLDTYASLLEKAQDYKSPLIEVIQMDTIRTTFEKDQEINRTRTSNILKTLACHHQDIGYCQGMSYICSFLLTKTDNEEKAFDIFNAIISNTLYGSLIINDFSVLKKYFYLFDRLVDIYIPEVGCFLKRHSVSASYYIAPWFITLFTNSFSYLPKGQIPIIVIRIFDLYFLEGWNAIINVGLCLIKHYETNLLKMKFEELLHFLINDIVKYDFFHSSNYENFINSYNKIKVSSGLISNLEEEYHKGISITEEKNKSNKALDNPAEINL